MSTSAPDESSSSTSSGSVTPRTPYSSWCDSVQGYLNFDLRDGSTPTRTTSILRSLRELWLAGFAPLPAAIMLWRMREGLPLEDAGPSEEQIAADNESVPGVVA